MNTHRNPNYDVNSKLCELSKAFASPIRISILKTLMNEEVWVNYSALEKLELPTSVLNRHLNALVYLGVIKSRHYNKNLYYKIEKEFFDELILEFNGIINHYRSH